jgi:predicted nucleic acid-binding protein
MILVDTSVWIDHFKNLNTPEAVLLQQLLDRNEDLCTCGIILTEVLQGIRDDAQYQKTRRYFNSLIYLPTGRAVYLTAAEIFRIARKSGETIRRTADCIIAACALAGSAVLLERDTDFDVLAKHSRLQLLC